MSALRESVRRPRFWIKLIAAVALATVAISDWSRPPLEQISVRVYDRAVVGSYRRFVRPYIVPFVRCRYQPTCSRYSEEAMQRFGFAKGSWLTTMRLLRCVPWVPMATLDPVPPPPVDHGHG